MGSAVSDMMVVRMFIKNKNSTITTKKAPSIKALIRLEMEASMKSL